MLESVTACRMIHESKPWLLTIAAVLAAIGLIGLVSEAAEFAVAFLFFAPLAVVLYYISRYQAIAITSPTAEIRLNTRGMSVASATNFIDRVERAKAERLEALRREQYA